VEHRRVIARAIGSTQRVVEVALAAIEAL